MKTATLNLPVILNESAKTLLFAGLSVSAFAVPFFLGHPQWLVGTVVNCSLFLAAIFLPKKFYLPLVVFPSLGVLAKGLIFGPFTPFLAYFLPFIWLGNLVLIMAFKNFYKVNYLFAVISAATLKFLFLFALANIYFNLSIVPKIFFTAMGAGQFLTALAGGLVSLIIFGAWKTKLPR